MGGEPLGKILTNSESGRVAGGAGPHTPPAPAIVQITHPQRTMGCSAGKGSHAVAPPQILAGTPQNQRSKGRRGGIPPVPVTCAPVQCWEVYPDGKRSGESPDGGATEQTVSRPFHFRGALAPLNRKLIARPRACSLRPISSCLLFSPLNRDSPVLGLTQAVKSRHFQVHFPAPLACHGAKSAHMRESMCGPICKLCEKVT